MDKVLPGNIFILISFKEKAFTQINSQKMNTFRISFLVDCAIQINFNPIRPDLFSRSPGPRGGSEARMPKIKVNIN